MYNNENIFAKIIRKELPSEIIFENEKIIAIKDKYPQAEIHILILPKGEYIDFADFISKAPKDDISEIFTLTENIAKKFSIDGQYKILTNKGLNAGQTIFHFHIHILSGENLNEHF